MNKEIEKYLEALEGLSINDWNKLKIGIDRMFELKRKELDKGIKSDSELVEKFIRSQFE